MGKWNALGKCALVIILLLGITDSAWAVNYRTCVGTTCTSVPCHCTHTLPDLQGYVHVQFTMHIDIDRQPSPMLRNPVRQREGHSEEQLRNKCGLQPLRMLQRAMHIGGGQGFGHLQSQHGYHGLRADTSTSTADHHIADHRSNNIAFHSANTAIEPAHPGTILAAEPNTVTAAGRSA